MSITPILGEKAIFQGAQMKEYLIIGNGVAGVSAAQALRRRDRQSPIHIFSDEPYPFYARIRLPQLISGQAKPADLFLHPAEWYKQQGIDLHLGERITGIDPQKRLVISAKGNYSYHHLLLASGSHSFVPPFPGAEQQGVFTLRSMQDALAVAEYARTIDTALMIGGGLLGLEAGYALLQAGVAVKVLEIFPRLLPRQTDEKASAILQKQMEAMGFQFYLGVKTKRILGQGQAGGVELGDGRKLEGQLVLISAGVRSNLGLAEAAGLKLNRGVLVDDNLCSSDPHIFAAGDVAEHGGRCYGIWPAAQEQGEIAGANLAGGNEVYRGTVMSNRLKVAGIDLVAAGELDAEGKYESKILEGEQTYRKLVFDQKKTLIGCLLLGDIDDYQRFLQAIREEKKLDKY